MCIRDSGEAEFPEHVVGDGSCVGGVVSDQPVLLGLGEQHVAAYVLAEFACGRGGEDSVERGAVLVGDLGDHHLHGGGRGDAVAREGGVGTRFDVVGDVDLDQCLGKPPSPYVFSI